MKPGSWLESLNCAIEGILWAAKSQRHMRFHFWVALCVLVASLFFRFSAIEFILIAFAVTLVLFAELVNTALETLVDMVSPEYHPLAKRVKDVAAGAVLVASIGAVFIGYLAFSGYFSSLLDSRFGSEPVAGAIATGAVLLVIIIVVLLKSYLGKGEPLHGGMPSGHSAVAFSIATSVIFSGTGFAVACLVLFMACLVSQSRLLMRIHSLWEVFVGAGIGIVVTVGLFFLLG